MRGEDARADLDSLKDALATNADPLARELFGEPSSRSRYELRFNSRGSIKVRVPGGRGAPFWSFEMGAGGSMLDAIMFADGCGFAEAVERARRWLGDGGAPRPRKVRPVTKAKADVDLEEQRAVEQAQRIWRAGRGVAGTAAGRYLVRRGLPEESTPDVVRFVGVPDVTADPKLRWWKWASVVFPLRNDAGEVRAVQIVALNDDGSPVPDPQTGRGKLKRSRGPLAGAVIRFPGPADAPLLLAEGPETSMSVALATGWETWANAGGIGRAPLAGVPLARVIVACRDDDPHGPARKAVKRAIAEWRREGRTVLEALPWAHTRRDKSDFNDLLQVAGPAAVWARINAALASRAVRDRVTRDEASEATQEAVRASFARLRGYHDRSEPPPFEVLRVGVAIGKTRAALAETIRAAAQGDRIVYTVPTHRLGNELLERAQKEARDQGASITFGVWRGSEADNPERPGETMCENLPLLKRAHAALENPRKTACRVCPKRDGCAYLAQDAKRAQLWFVPTALLFHKPPDPIGRPDLAVIDEGFALNGLEGIEGHPLLVTRDMLEAPPDHGRGQPGATADLRATLVPARKRLLAALETAPEGWLGRDHVAAGFLSDECHKLAGFEWERQRKLDEGAYLDEAAMRHALDAAAGNEDVKRMAGMWTKLAALVDDDGPPRSGRLICERKGEGDTFSALRLVGAKRIAKGWRVPTLNIDATANIDLIRARAGKHASLIAEIEAGAPHVQMIQYVGAFGKNGLKSDEGKRLERIWLRIVADASWWGGKWLVVANKEIAEKIAATFYVPPFIKLAHFNGVRGVDEYRDVRGVAILGRPMPSVQAVETLRGAISGSAPSVTVDGYHKGTLVTVEAKDGTRRTVETEFHPDRLAEAIRATICEGELVQAIGRGRGVNRGPDDPLLVIVYGGTPVPGLVPDVFMDWQPPSVDVQAFARTGIWLELASDMAKIAGMSESRIRMARGSFRKNTKEEYLLGNLRKLGALKVGYYRVERTGRGAGQYHRAVFDRRTAGDLRRCLEGRIGPLKSLHDPTAPDGGIVRCQVTGGLNLGFADPSGQDGAAGAEAH